MTACVALLAVAVAVPRAEQRLPYVERCHVIGSTEAGVTNVVVQGQNVPVYKTGAWAAYIDVREGENTIVVSCEESGGVSTCERTFFVAAKPTPRAPSPAPVYNKLDYAGDVPKAHPAGKAPREVTVVLDPGHGGKKDLGSLSPHGWFEKDANLLLSEAVREELVKLGYRVVPTRRNDRAITLYDRPQAIYAVNADAFISIHHNAPPINRDAAAIRYSAVYCWNPIGEALAGAIARRMAEVQAPDVKSNGVIYGNLAVTRNPEVPSCLIEADFITNPAGEEAVWNPECRRRLAEAIAAGFADWHKGPVQ